jgi:hypothetical protein
MASLSQSAGYGPLVANLARQALVAACDAAPHQPPEQAWQRSLTLGLPAARCMVEQEQQDDLAGLEQGLGQLAEAARLMAQGGRPRFTDGFGHHRTIYHLLLLHVHLRALRQGELAELGGGLSQSVAGAIQAAEHWLAKTPDEADAALSLWAALCLHEAARLEGATSEAEALGTAEIRVGSIVERPGEAGALRPQRHDEPFDEWTYRELAGLHALDRLAAVADREDWQQRVSEVTEYHQFHTQPDYTTYQPWALAAFAARMETSMFAEQQLHDVTVHLQTGGPAAALVPALLLADAAASLNSK